MSGTFTISGKLKLTKLKLLLFRGNQEVKMRLFAGILGQFQHSSAISPVDKKTRCILSYFGSMPPGEHTGAAGYSTND